MPRIDLGDPPSAPAERPDSNPIGVPADYRAPLPGGGGIIPGIPFTEIAPRYYDGDEWLPAAMSAEDVARLQRMLEDAGAIPANARYRLGIWDDTSREAYRSVLGYANGSGLTVQQALAQIGQAPPEEPEPQQLPTYRVSNPDDLRSVFEAVAQETIGRKIDQDQIAKMIAAYQQAEMQPQVATTADQMGGGGGTVTPAPDPTVFAEQQIREANPVEAESNDQVRVFGDFMKIITGGQT